MIVNLVHWIHLGEWTLYIIQLYQSVILILLYYAIKNMSKYCMSDRSIEYMLSIDDVI